MAIEHSNVTVGTTAGELLAGSQRRNMVLVHNNADTDIFLGGDDTVTTTNGFPLGAGDTFAFSKDSSSNMVAGMPLWAISASAGRDVRLLVSTD